MYDVPKEQYVTVIREMIRHENDLTNHRTMWLLIVQGLLANAYVAARGGGGTPVILMLSLVEILVTLSAFVMLYKSYQAGAVDLAAQSDSLGDWRLSWLR